MGITIIQKSDLTVKKENSKIALVLSGGTVSGAAFKIGGLKALNDFLVNKKITDFDIYVGLSAGAMLAVPICGGITPEEMLASLDGQSKAFSQLSPFDIYHLNLSEFLKRPLRFLYKNISFLPGMLFDVLKATPRIKENFLENSINFLKNPTYSNYEILTNPILRIATANRRIPMLGELLPSGIFDNKQIEKFLRKNMRENQMPNNFRVLKRMTGKSLYISAMDLDAAKRVVFGPDEKNDVPISKAVQASSATPIFYKPACVKGIDYVDGGVRKTVNIDLAFNKGADLVICYNPFKPYNNELFLEYLREDNKYITKNERISDLGLGSVLNQVLRTLFHSRLQNSLEFLAKDPDFTKDLIVIEPDENDDDHFMMNPLFHWTRAKAAKLGFDSVKEAINKDYDKVEKILNSYGITMTSEVVDGEAQKINHSYYDDRAIMETLENPRKKKKLKVIKGGKN